MFIYDEKDIYFFPKYNSTLKRINIQIISPQNSNAHQWRIQDLWKGRAGNPNAAMPRQAWKSRSAGGGGGGLQHIFSPEFFWCHLHYGVGVGAYQTDLRGEKQKKKKK